MTFEIHEPVRDTDGLVEDGTPVEVAPSADIDGETFVYVEAKESDGDNKQVEVAQLFGADDDKDIPASHFATAGVDGTAGHGVLYAMDDNDTYIKDGAVPPPCEIFRPAADQQVRVVIYSADSDKTSIFDIDTDLTEQN